MIWYKLFRRFLMLNAVIFALTYVLSLYLYDYLVQLPLIREALAQAPSYRPYDIESTMSLIIEILRYLGIAIAFTPTIVIPSVMCLDLGLDAALSTRMIGNRFDEVLLLCTKLFFLAPLIVYLATLLNISGIFIWNLYLRRNAISKHELVELIEDIIITILIVSVIYPFIALWILPTVVH